MTENEFRKEIGTRVRRARRGAELTQKELSRKLGLTSVSYMCEVEKGRRGLPAYTLFRLEEILETRISL